MNSLNYFQSNNHNYLFQLCKKLNECGFFQSNLSTVNYNLLSYILSLNNLKVFTHLIDSNLYLIFDESSVNIDDEFPLRKGCVQLNLLALKLRYFLWEKAISSFYEDSSNSEAQDYALLDKIDLDEERETRENAAVTVREEDDDYDDDDEESPDSKENVKDLEFNYNEVNQLILELPSDVIQKILEVEKNEDSDDNNNNHLHMIKILNEFNKFFKIFDSDKENLIKRQKLEKSDKQLENFDKILEQQKTNTTTSTSTLNSINLGSAKITLKNLLNLIDNKRDALKISDYELKNLIYNVRKNTSKWSNEFKIGQEELYESCEKVINELRSYTEHSTPFLHKVSKRDAPNYYQIIKNPMDLNTILKKLKAYQYNSKKEFVNDLILIWSNCLTYNTDPKHFIRHHAIQMQKKSSKLIPLIPDIVIKDRVDDEVDDQNLRGASKGHSTKGKKRTQDTSEIDREKEQEKAMHEKEIELQKAKESANEREKEKQQNINIDLLDLEYPNDLENNEIDRNDNDNDNDIENEIENETSNQIEGAVIEEDSDLLEWKNITSKLRSNYCSKRADLFKDNKLNLETEAILRNHKMIDNDNYDLINPEESKSFKNLDLEDLSLYEYDLNILPSLKYKGIDDEISLIRENEMVDYILDKNIKINERKDEEEIDNKGLNGVFLSNIQMMQQIRKVCFKIALIRQFQNQQFVHHTQLKQPTFEEIKNINFDEISKMLNYNFDTKQFQFSLLKKKICQILLQNGFESTHSFAINTLTQIGETYMNNLIKTMKLHSEKTSKNQLSPRKILLITLLENGVHKPDELNNYIQEKVINQKKKLIDLHDKLSNFLKNLLKPNIKKITEQNFDDNSDQFVTGDFSSELGDDFFGFKELGLDKEFNLISNSIPLNLLNLRLNSSFSSSNVINSNKYGDLEDVTFKKLSLPESQQQIGLLQGFLHKIIEISERKFKKKNHEHSKDFHLIEDDDLPLKHRNNRPKLPPNGKISNIKRKPISSGFWLPDESD